MYIHVVKQGKLLTQRQATSHDAFRALVNLSDSTHLVNALSETSFLKFIISYILVRHSSR